MARLSSIKDQQISLFPIFNILVCTLGVLIFVLVTVVAVSLGVGKTISLVPDMKGTHRHQKKPTYTEWNGTDLILHPSLQKVCFDIDLKKFETFKEGYAYLDKIIEGSPIEAVLNNIIEHRDSNYLFVFVRPSGFHNFIMIRGYIEDKKIDIGYEPIDQGWNIRIGGDDNAQKNER